MQIVKKEQNKIGAYPPIQSWGCGTIPDGYAIVSCDTDIFYAYNGFVTLTIAENEVIGMEPNLAAWEKWKAEEAAKPKPEEIPTQEERNRADIDYLALMGGVAL